MKSIGDLFSELTDLDKGYLRTILTLIRSPKKVLDAYLVGETPYTKPLRFALISASVYFVLANLYTFFFDSPTELLVWVNPSRTMTYYEKLENVKSGFDPFIQLITIIPLSIVFLKLLFQKKQLSEIAVIILYGFGLFWFIQIFLLPIPDFIFSALLKPLTALIIVFVLFRNVMQGRLLLSLGRWFVFSLVLISWVTYVSDPLIGYAVAKVAFKDLSTGLIKPNAPSPLKLKTLTFPEDQHHHLIRDDAENRLVQFARKDGGINFKCIDEDLREYWEVYIPELSDFQFIKRISLDSSASGFLIIGESQAAGATSFYGRAIVLSDDGKIYYTRIEENTIINDGLIINHQKLLIVGGKNSNDEVVPFVEIIDFNFLQKTFTAKTETTYHLSNPGQRFKHAFYLNSTPGKVNLLVSNYENAGGRITSGAGTEISQLSIMHLEIDSVIHTKWEHILFKKTGQYSPRLNNFITRYDIIHQRIFVSYRLADDEVSSTRLFSVSMNGDLLWKKKLIEDEYTTLMDIAPDTSRIYFSGAIRCIVPKHPLVISYGLAIAGSVSLDGTDIKIIKYGKFRSISYDEFFKLTVKASTVELMYNHSGRLWGSTILSGENEFARITFRKKDL